MLTSPGLELQKAHNPVVRSGSFCTFPGRWDYLCALPILFFQAPPGPRTSVVILLFIPKVVAKFLATIKVVNLLCHTDRLERGLCTGFPDPWFVGKGSFAGSGSK